MLDNRIWQVLIVVIAVSSAGILLFGDNLKLLVLRQTTSGCNARLQDGVNGIEQNDTIDPDMQANAQHNVELAVAAQNAKKGLILVQHIKSGEVRAIAAANGTRGGCFYGKAEAFNQWEPGSVIKPLTMAIAINEGRLHPDDEFYNAGSRIFGDTIILNAINIAPGMYSYKDMISQSINTGSVAALESLSDNNAIDQQSKQTWYQYMTSVFGFSEYTGAATIEDKGYIPLVDSPFSTQARYAFSSHGIGITVTPMQLTSAYSTLLNHGKYITPKLFSKNNSYRSTLITDQTSSTMQHMLFLATERSNTKALHQGYVMGGKSGTGPSADVSGLYQYYRSNGVYVGYVGKDNPEYIVLAKIDEPEDDQVLASRFAADLWTLQINDIIKEL